MLYRRTGPTVPNPSTYEPSLLVIAQGRIRVDLVSELRFRPIEISRYVSGSAGYEPGDYGREKAPYLAFFLKLDMSTVRDILTQKEVSYS